MSTVLRVFDRLLLRETAQKLMDPRYVHSARHLERFTSEAQITGQLEHPNIVPIHDFGTDDQGQPFITMKLVEGDTLGDLVRAAGSERLDPDVLAGFVRILLKVCDALAFAHSKGVIHRDLNPANIMVGQFGEVYLMDWGVSARTDLSPIRSENDPRSTDISGTPAYMAPEQIRGAELDHRTDVFALGATLYFVLTGEPPYPGPSAIQALNQAMDCAWAPLADRLGTDTPAGIDLLVQRCMARDPADRYASIQAVQADLDAWLRGRWHLPTRVYKAGEVVVREGEEAREAFLIVRGMCEARRVTADRTITLSTMGPGDAFGEMAIFGQMRRTSTVVATSTLEVQVVNRTSLSSAAGLDTWVGKFVSAVTARFLDAEARLQRLQDQVERMKTQLEALDRASEKP
jgi:serine/threonine-protein kinase